MKTSANAMRKIAAIAAAMTMAVSVMGAAISAQTVENTVNGAAAVVEYTASANQKNEIDFDNLKIGMSKDKILKNCGISDYHEMGEGTNCYAGSVVISGEKCKIDLEFNKNNELYTYSIYSNMDYASFVAIFNSNVLDFGSGMDYDKESDFYSRAKEGSLCGGIEYYASTKNCMAVIWDSNFLN